MIIIVEIKANIREELDTKAIDTYQELGRGGRIFTRNNGVSFVGMADMPTIFSVPF